MKTLLRLLPLCLSLPLVAQELPRIVRHIGAEDLMRHIRVLSSDDFGGRGPATEGEEKTVAYLVEHFRESGLEPGFDGGSWTQEVPLVGVRSTSRGTLHFGSRTVELAWPQDHVAWTARPEPRVDLVESPLVFVGYGVEAPEYRWDDFKDLDCSGKTLLMLVNDPQIPHPGDPSRLDPDLFKGREMTYYGRWTYKLEQAARKGASGVVIIHETGPAGYPYFVVINSWSGENFTLVGGEETIPVAAWFSTGRARTLLSSLGHDLDELKERALRRDFNPVPLGARISLHLENETRTIVSRNVMGRITGKRRPGEAVVVSAHWDHLGTDPRLQGDRIYNGARDNATGLAGMLELAQAMAALEPGPERTLLFLATAAEEQGLLGARYYAENPVVPLNRTLANLNLDSLNQWGRTRDIVVIGRGTSTLDSLVEWAAGLQGRVVKGDPEPEKGYNYRFDHFQFAKSGVPAISIDSGIEYRGRPEGYGMEKRNEYRRNDYHSVSDEIKPGWDLSGMVEDLQLQAAVLDRIDRSPEWPAWFEGNEFRAVRERSLGRGR